jgi:hypothetical protein
VIVSKIEAYRIEHSTWPDNDQGLALLTDGHASPTASYYLGPDKLLDPWGHTYLYICPGPDGHPYEVIMKSSRCTTRTSGSFRRCSPPR